MSDYAFYQAVVQRAKDEADTRAAWAAKLAPRPEPCVMTEAEAHAADRLNDHDKAGQAHRAQYRAGLRAQLNDKSEFFA